MTANKRLYDRVARQVALHTDFGWRDWERALKAAGAHVTDTGGPYIGDSRCARCHRKILLLYPIGDAVYGEKCFRHMGGLE